ncbi:MAG: hypothetical protein IJ593_05410, partial [Lachnospiraceae bacterium]|nr:hypothetical protein [Lachnospiraceae bacterium]
PIQFGVISKVVDKQYDEFGLSCILLNDTEDTIKFNVNNKDILINGIEFKGTAALENKLIRPHQYYILNLEFSNETLKNNSIESYEDIKQLSLKPTYSISNEVMKLGTWVINLE